MNEFPKQGNVILREGKVHYLWEESKKEESGEGEALEDNDFDNDETFRKDQDDGEITILHGMIRKALIEDLWPQKWESMISNYVVRRAMISKSMDDLRKRENLFHSKCFIKKNICYLVIDSRSCANFTSATMVDFLKLSIPKHIAPCKLQWLN